VSTDTGKILNKGDPKHMRKELSILIQINLSEVHGIILKFNGKMLTLVNNLSADPAKILFQTMVLFTDSLYHSEHR